MCWLILVDEIEQYSFWSQQLLLFQSPLSQLQFGLPTYENLLNRLKID